MKNIKNTLKIKITQLSSLIKEKISGKKSVQSLIFLTFMFFVPLEGSRKYRQIKGLSYIVLKQMGYFGYKLLRKFSLREFIKDFTYWTNQSDSFKSKHRVKARIDTTKTGKKYGKVIPELRILYDYVNKCYIKTHELYVFLVSIGNKDYVIDFVLVKKSKNIGSNEMAQKMIDRFLKSLGTLKENFKHYGRVSLDGAWGNGEMLRYFAEKRFQYAVMKSGGKDIVLYNGQRLKLIELEKELIEREDFKEFKAKHNLKGEYFAVTVDLESHNLKIRVVLRRFKRKGKKKYRYLMLLSSNILIRDYQIAQCYAGRWGIEECIKECKQVLDLTKYSYHTKGKIGNIEVFLALRFICYMILNWYRAEHCRISKTSLWKVSKRFRDYFNKISAKAVWNTFSP